MSHFPLGLAFVVSALRCEGHEVVVLDLMFLQEWKEKLLSTLDVLHPDVIGLSIRNIDNQDMHKPVFFLSSHLKIVKAIRGHSNVPIILGGAGFNIHPAGCLRYLDADFGTYGEGEESFPHLLDAMQDGTFALENILYFLYIEVASALNLLHPLKMGMAKSLKIV